MGQTTDQIAADIDRTREDLEANLRELEDRAKSMTDWRSQFRKHPMGMIAAAVVGGMVLAAVFGGRSSTD